MSSQSDEGILSPFLRSRRMNQVKKFLVGKVLDFGCGNGDLGVFCEQGSYVGYDIDIESILDAKKRHPELKFVNQFPSINGSLEKFDTIILSAVIEHLNDPISVLGRLKGDLKPGGNFVITTPHPIFEWIHTLGAGLGIFSTKARFEHKTLFDKATMDRVALETNLSVVIYRRFLLGANQLFILKSCE
jgi:2-polyprenyl-3-methyl-5-hydroxy-6-metoxy-1,4-benzoquinol methylase